VNAWQFGKDLVSTSLFVLKKADNKNNKGSKNTLSTSVCTSVAE